MRQATVHYCVIISIICVYHVIVKIRFQLGKLVHSCQKTRNRVSDQEGAWSSLGGSWL